MFSPMLLVAGGVTLALAFVDKALEGYGFYWLGDILKFVIPIAAFAAGIYFIETNAILGWLR